MPVIRPKFANGRPHGNPPNNYLWNHRKNVYSQSGEDGIIAEIFRKIGTTNKWAVEFGAWDGVHLSNTRNLILHSGWSCVMIEGEDRRAKMIKDNYPGHNVHGISAFLGFNRGVDTIDDYLKTTPIPKVFDLVSIDVDGMDYHLWHTLQEYRARVVCIEFNHLVPNDVVFIQDRDGRINEGHSLAALVELGKERNYELVGVIHRNAFFVTKEELPKFRPEITDNSIDAIRPFQPSYIWSCYNGKMYHTIEKLRWPLGAADSFDLKPDSLQLFKDFAWRSNDHQGRKDDPAAAAGGDAGTGTAQAVAGKVAPVGDPAAAESILRELLDVRRARKTMPEEERRTRHRKAWQAAKLYFKQAGRAQLAAASAAKADSKEPDGE